MRHRVFFIHTYIVHFSTHSISQFILVITDEKRDLFKRPFHYLNVEIVFLTYADYPGLFFRYTTNTRCTHSIHKREYLIVNNLHGKLYCNVRNRSFLGLGNSSPFYLILKSKSG